MLARGAVLPPETKRKQWALLKVVLQESPIMLQENAQPPTEVVFFFTLKPLLKAIPAVD